MTSERLSHWSSALLLALCLSVCAISAQAASILGMSLADAKKQDIFTFFHFKEMERQPDKDGASLVLLGTECMGNSVIMILNVVGKEDRITLASLILPRKFVDGPTVGVFARDITKSFLIQTIPDADLPACKTLITEIAFGGQKPEPVKDGKTTIDVVTGTKTKDGIKLVDQKSTPKLPDTPTPGYAAYLGKQQKYMADFSQCGVNLINTEAKGTPTLNILINRRSR